MISHAESKNALNAIRSFLPERTLIYHVKARGALAALALKYEAGQSTHKMSDRMLALAALAGFKQGTLEHGTFTWFDAAGCIEVGSPFPATAHDPETGTTLSHGTMDVTQMHVLDFQGLDDARQRLGEVANFIATDPEIRKTPYIGGITYSEMARLGTRLGMRSMEVTDLDRKFEAHLRASHTWTFMGSEKPREFKPAVVYLPTEEFIERFGQSSLSAESAENLQ